MQSVKGRLAYLRMLRVVVQRDQQRILDDLARNKQWLEDTEEQIDGIETQITNLESVLDGSSTME